MDVWAVVRKGKGLAVGFVALVGTCPLAAPATAGDLMSTICNNQVVSVGARKGEVSAKCGPPLSKSQDTVSTKALQSKVQRRVDKKADTAHREAIKKKTIKEKEETWTYNMDGSYRFFIFKEGKLARIETGRLAP